MFSPYQVNVPQLTVNVDRVKAKQQGVKLTDVFQTMQVYLGSLYVNDFNRFGRTYQVVAQADAPFRAQKEDILKLKTRNANGDMVPLGALITIEQTFGPDVVAHYNGYRSAEHQRRTGSGLQLRSGGGGDHEDSRCDAAARHELRVDRSLVPAEGVGRHDDRWCSRCAWCSCSSCWPPSTRA